MKPRIKSMIWNIRNHKTIKSEQQKEKRMQKKNEDSISSLWDNFKCTNIRTIGELEGEEKEQELKIYLKK